ncbi:MFS transporter, partial [Streptomyces sp. H27-D2]|uniref:MFS transporter n=1 Tax=Streptomyces sp. H27-D2 TaxID=3046304 RepID=UPI002DB5BFC2
MGDALRGAALPLLAYGLTDSPFLIALVTACGFLPWLLFGLLGGAVADRVDQRRAMWAVDAARGVLMAAFALTVALGHATIGLLLALAFALTTLQTLFDNAATALLPSVVPRAALSKANARLMTGQEIAGRFVGAPLVPLLLGLGLAVPFAVDAASYFLAAALIASLRPRRVTAADTAAGAAAGAVTGTRAGAASEEATGTRAGAASEEATGAAAGAASEEADGTAATGAASAEPVEPPAAEGPTMRRDIAEGIRVLRGDRVLRALCVSTTLCNIGVGALIATLVVLVKGWLDAGNPGFVAATTAYGIGSVAGGLVAGWVADRCGQARALLACGVLQFGCLLTLGAVRELPAAVAALRPYTDRELRFHFVSNVDGADLHEALRDLDAAETLFVIASK